MTTRTGRMRKRVFTCAAALAGMLAMVGCDDRGGSDPDTATDTAHDPVTDVQADATDDPVTDTLTDPVTDTSVEPDALEDVAEDPGTDTVEDTEPDTLVGACTTDLDCEAGSQWCGEGGFCEPCDNSGLTCELACGEGMEMYERNGCHPCDCAPVNDCTSDEDCPDTEDGAGHCYPGEVCMGGCGVACCHGNVCAAAGCSEPPDLGCRIRGCDPGSHCTGGSDCDHTACRVATCSGGDWTLPAGCDCGLCTYGGDL